MVTKPFSERLGGKFQTNVLSPKKFGLKLFKHNLKLRLILKDRIDPSLALWEIPLGGGYSQKAWQALALKVVVAWELQ